MKKDISFKAIKRIEEYLGVKQVEMVKDFSNNLRYKDEKETYIPADFDYCGYIRREPIEEDYSPFYRVNILCIIQDENSASLVLYKAFAIDNKGITFIQEDINYILKDMDKHIFTNGHRYGYWGGTFTRELDLFFKDNALYGITYLNNKLHKFDIKGKAVPSTFGGSTFYSIEGNTIYEQSIKTGKEDMYGVYQEYNDYLNLESSVYYKDEKEICNMEFIDKGYRNNGFITASPDIRALIITFNDGTKKLIVENTEGKKAVSKYFNDLQILIAAVYITKKQFEKEKPENKQSWNCDAEGTYFIPGLTLDYIADDDQGRLIVKNDGDIIDKSKKKINKRINNISSTNNQNGTKD